MSEQKLFSDYLKKKRVEAGVTQAVVSKKLGYKTPQFISHWERGRAHPPIKAISKLIKLYDIDADEVANFFLASTEEQLHKAFQIARSK